MAGGKGKITAADGKPFVKDDPRINKAGRPLKLPDLDRLLVEVLGEEVNGKQALKLMLIALRKKANAGDVRANELLLDRAYGKLRTDVSFDIKKLSKTEAKLLVLKLFKKE